MALFGVNLTAFDKFFAEIIANDFVLLLVFLGFLSVTLAFGISLYALPARRGYQTIPRKGWGELSQGVYRLPKNGSSHLYARFLTDFIARIDEVFAYNIKTNRRRAFLSRTASTVYRHHSF
nr:MAG: hypothetical protein BECKTUN1418E_GA0071001_101528 [Candidatus Kentron sp. TUN]VFK56889.1 MAG: hypothetical protein BECKTUN1418D_GA0071000_10556 [Candidatus Kentron sp. TUN]